MIRSICLAALAANVATHTLAGPLTPPPGAPAPTNKTLQEVEPRIPLSQDTTPGDATATFIITQPGSYYLTDNLNTTATGIRVINNVDVLLDLNGFCITGDGTGNGVSLSSSSIQPSTVTIKNGFIRNMSRGVSSSSDYDVVAENVHARECGTGFRTFERFTLVRCSASDCTGDGFETVNPFSSEFKDCWAESNGNHGFNVTGRLINCSASFNGADGFLLGAGSIATGCAASFSGANGFNGFFDVNLERCHATLSNAAGFVLTDGATASHCVARQNTTAGFQATDGAALNNCTARDTTSGPGFTVGNGALLSGCVAESNNAQGFESGLACVFDACLARDNGNDGFDVSLGSTVVNCGSYQNAGIGFLVANGGRVSNCAAVFNADDGFRLLADGRVSHCLAEVNGAGTTTVAGFRGASDVTIDSCTATDNPIGFVGGVGGLVIRCAAAGNSQLDWDLTGADHGAIITPAGTFTSTNAFANISY